MKSAVETCESCGSALKAISPLLGSVCPVCSLRSTCTPDPVSSDGLTTWAEVFPQLEMERSLRESDGWSIYLARVLGEGESRRAILQVVSKNLFEEAGGAAALGIRAQNLLAADLEGVAAVLDFGDLVDAFFFVTEAPDLPTLTQCLAERNPANLGELVKSAARKSAEIGVRARNMGIALPFDPDLCFVDEESGVIVLTPSLLPGPEDGEEDRPARWEVAEAMRLGPFQLEERIGEGGFGEVWRARQERPVQRIVAIKVLKASLHSRRARARFEVEQQALAKLEHPQIARFFDGGTTPDGRPYFAMEWVDGKSLAHYMKEDAASLTERLRLFRQVCEAVHHAHQKGIMHRDLKSSNVMITPQGGQPVAKVIDFGIARALEDPLTDHTRLTRAEEFLGTPAAMSPEQAAGAGGADLDARTDVYGLGVLLYELLTGTLPFDPKLPVDELRRRIREDDPPKPSSRVEDSSRARQVRGDLDWITRRCLEKDPERRYRSVSALLRDLERQADNQPIEARPPELSDRLKKFVRRNRSAVASGVFAALALIAGLVLAMAGLHRAQLRAVEAREAEKTAKTEAAVAEEVTAFFKKHFFGQLDPHANENWDLTLREATQRASKALDSRPLSSTRLEAELRIALAGSLQELGQLAEAAAHLSVAADLLEASPGVSGADRAELLAKQARLLSELGRLDQAVGLQRQVVEHWIAEEGPESKVVLKAKWNLSNYLIADSHYREGLGILEEVVREQQARLGPDDPATLDSLAQLSRIYAEVERNHFRARELHQQINVAEVYHRGSIACITTLHRLRGLQVSQDDLEILRSRIAGMVYREEAPDLDALRLRVELAKILIDLGHYKEGLSHLEPASKQLQRVLGESHPSLSEVWSYATWAFHRAGNRVQVPNFLLPIVRHQTAHSGESAEMIRAGRPYFGMLGLWGEATYFYREAAPMVGLEELLEGMVAAVAADDAGSFRAMREAVLSQYGQTSDPYTAKLIADGLLAETFLDGTEGAVDLDVPAALLAQVRQQKPQWQAGQITGMRLALARGDHQAARQTADELLQREARDDPKDLARFWPRIVRALCAVRAGDRGAAERDLRWLQSAWKQTHPARIRDWPQFISIACGIDLVERELGSREGLSRVAPERFCLQSDQAGDGRVSAIKSLRQARFLALRESGHAFTEAQDLENALVRYEACRDLGEELFAPDDGATIRLMWSLEFTHRKLGHPEKAIEILERLLSDLEESKQPDEYMVIDSRFRLGLRYFDVDELRKGAEILQALVSQLERQPDADPEYLFRIRVNLCGGYMQLEEFERAAAVYDDLLAPEAPIGKFPKDHCWDYAPIAFRKVGRHEESIALARKAVEVRRKALGAEHDLTWQSERLLGLSLYRGGRVEEAIRLWERLLVRRPEPPHPRAIDRLPVLASLAEACRESGREADRDRFVSAYRELAAKCLAGYYDDALKLDTSGDEGTVLISPYATWRCRVGSPSGGGANPDPHQDFHRLDFDDSSWRQQDGSQTGGFAYWDGENLPGWIDAAPLADNPAARPSSAMFRHRFSTDERFDHLQLVLQHDDGVVVFLDGREVARNNVLEGPVSHGLHASSCRSSWNPVRIPLPGPLEAGTHLLAISLHDHDCFEHDLRLAGVRLVGWNAAANATTEKKSPDE